MEFISLKYIFLFLLNLSLFFLTNFFFLRKNFLLDKKITSSHKQLINNEIVPISGGIILMFNVIFLNYFINFANLAFLLSVFFIGLLADLQKFNSPKIRLIIQTLIVIIFINFNDSLIRSIKISYIDDFLTYDFAAIIFTSFCLLILINGSNFIDGVNLQCSGYFFVLISIIIFLDTNIIQFPSIEILYYLILFLVPFILLNYFNKSYLGDGGSYLLSFIIGYLLINFQIETNVSPYFIVLLLWYPAFENFFSIIRRLFKSKKKPDKPDLLHLHHFIYLAFRDRLNFNKNLQSSFPSIVINLFNLFIFYIACDYIYSTGKLIFLIFICILTYVLFYLWLLNLNYLKNPSK